MTPPRLAPWPRRFPRRCAITPTGLRSKSRANAVPSRCSTRTSTSPAPAFPPACRMKSRHSSAATGSATRTSFRLPPRAPSASPSQTTHQTASSPRSRGPTRARSACPMALSRNSRSRTMPGAPTVPWAETHPSFRPGLSRRWTCPLRHMRKWWPLSRLSLTRAFPRP